MPGVLIDSSDPDNLKVLYDVASEKVLFQPSACQYSVSFDAKIGSGEYVPGYWALLFFCGPVSIQVKEDTGLLGWYINGVFYAAVDQVNFFDNYHTYTINFTYNDGLNTWSFIVNVAGTTTGPQPCGAPQWTTSLVFEAESNSDGSAALLDRRVRNVNYTFAFNVFNYVGDTWTSNSGVTFVGDEIIFESVNPWDDYLYVEKDFDQIKQACCFRDVTEISVVTAAVSGSGSGSFSRCCCGSGGSGICGDVGDSGPCDFWPPPCDVCVPFPSCSKDAYCHPGSSFTQNCSGSASGTSQTMTRVNYDGSGPGPGASEFELYWGWAGGTDLSPNSCLLFANQNPGTIDVGVPAGSGFDFSDCQDCTGSNPHAQSAQAGLIFDTGFGSFIAPTRGAGSVKLDTIANATFELPNCFGFGCFVSCNQESSEIFFTGFDLTPVLSGSYTCSNSDSSGGHTGCQDTSNSINVSGSGSVL